MKGIVFNLLEQLVVSEHEGDERCHLAVAFSP